MILAIESTCDETGAAVVKRDDKGIKILSNVIASSSEMHEKYGGIVPEVASREQVKTIIPVIKEALVKAGVTQEEIEAIAVAYGPGLVGSLLIGIETAKTLAYAWGKQLIAVNHMEAHVLANWIDREGIKLPAVALVVSGGHTDLIYLENMEGWRWIGGTRDDAAGECFDKCARILGLPYPGGPSIQKASELFENMEKGSEGLEVRLPRPMLNQDTFEMSFSGLKSALASLVRDLEERDNGKIEKLVPYLAREVNEAVVEVLSEKTMKAVEMYQPRSLLLAGGVAANTLLREELKRKLKKINSQVGLFMPEMKYCTDNAAMIGVAAILRPNKVEMFGLRPDPGLELRYV